MEGACPLCTNASWSILDGIVNIPLQKYINTPPVGTLPAATIVCTNCGYVIMLSMQQLGVIPPTDLITAESTKG